MKKLIAMIGAVAMSFGLFADATPFSISFEAAESAKGVSEGTFTPPTGWTWAGDPLALSQYASEVLPYGNPLPARRDDMFTGLADNNYYLPLETGTDELVREVGTDNIFLDQLVKFTGFEDPQTNLTGTAKIAIWMSEFENEDESTETNLFVTVGKVTGAGVEQIKLAINTNDNYKLNTWYRLTVKSIGGIYSSAVSDSQRAGFLVWINGKPAVCDDEAAKSLTTYSGEMSSVAAKYMAQGRLFTAIDATDATFASVGYQGIGAVDDIILDDVGPTFTVETVDVTFADVTGAEVDTVTDSEGTVDVNPDGSYSVKPGTVTVTLVAAEGYKMKSGAGTYEVNAQSAGELTIPVEEGDFVEVYATKNGTDEYGEDELYTMITGLVNDDVVEFNKNATINDGDRDIYDFTENTTIEVAVEEDAITWNVTVHDTEDGAGAFTDNVGVDAGNTLNVSFESDEEAYMTLNAGVAGTLKVEVGMLVVESEITVSGTIEAASMDDGSDVTLEGTGKVITQVGDLESIKDADGNLIVPTEGEEGWYTYALSDEPEKIDLEFTNLPTDTAVTLVEGDTVEGNAEDGWKAEKGDALTITLTAQNGKVFDETGATTTTVDATAAAQIDLGTAPAPFEAAAKVNNEKFYATLAAAFAAAGADDEIVLLKDVELDACIDVAKAVTLDIGDYSITPKADALAANKKFAEGTTKDALFVLHYGADFTVIGDDGVIDTEGNLYAAIKLTEAGDQYADTPAKLTVNANLTGTYYAITGSGNPGRGGTEIVINGGLIKGTAENDCAGIYHPQAGTLTINGGTIEGATGIYAKAGNCEVTVASGATIKGVGAKADYRPYTDGFYPTGDAIVFDSCNYPGGDPNAEIAGGTFESTYAAAVAAYATAGEEPVTGIVTGGSFKGQVAPDPALAGGSMAFPTFVPGEAQELVPAVASVNDVNYKTAAEALAAVQALEATEDFPIVATALADAGLTIVNPETEATITIAKDDTVTIDENSWTFSGSITITGQIGLAAGAAFTVVDQIANYTTVFSAPTDYEVTEIENANGTFTYSAAQSAAKVAKIGTDEYATLADAVAAAAEAGEAVKIELLDNVTEDVAISGVEGELDLGDFTLTGTISVTDSTLEISNGTIDYGTGTFTVNSGTVTLAEDATMTGAGSAEPINVKGGTFNIYGTINDCHTGDSFVIVLKSGATVNAYEGCSITGGSSVFKPKCEPGKAYLNIYGGTFTVNHPSDKNIYGVFYGTKDGDTTEITIAGGTFVVNGGGKCMFYDCSDMIILDADGEAGLDDTCTATFNINPLGGVTEVTEEKLCKTGYVVEQSEEDGLWRIVKYVPPVAKIGTDEYATLADAVAAAAEAGEAVKIELLDNVTENVAISGVEGELDLGDFTLTSTISVTDSTLTISNGTIDYGTGTFTVNSGTVTLAADATMTGAGSAEPINVKGGTFNIYGTINDCHTGDSFVIVLKSGATVNAYEGCSITGGSSVFKPKCEPGKAYVNIYGGTFTVNHPSDKNIYGVFYGTKDGDTSEITIAGGTFVVNGGGKCMFYDCSDMIILDADGEAGLDDTCTATFNINPLGGVTEVTEEKLCKSGYTVEQSAEDGLWRIVKEYTIALDDADDMTYTVNTVFPLALPTPAESGKGEFLGWTNATVTTPITQIAAQPDPLADLEFFAAYKAVGPEWPEDWPKDVPDTMKEAFATWADTYKVESFAGAEDAFLMNVDPTGTVPALEIQEISVEGTTATITVGTDATEFDLSKINGVLYVESTDELAGEWTIEQYDLPTGDVGQTATFTVTAGKFMRAKVGFKAPVVE